MRLQLAEQDILPELASTSRSDVPTRRGPWIGAGIALVLVVLGVLLWMKGRSPEPVATPEGAVEDGRSSAVLAQPDKPTAAVAQPSAVQAAPPTQPVPAQPALAATPEAAAPAQPKPEAPAAAPAAAPIEAKPAAVAPTGHAKASKPKEARARQHSSSSTQRAPSGTPETVESIQGARAALKGLDSAPVLSVKPSDDSAGNSDAPPPAPDGPSADAPPAPGE